MSGSPARLPGNLCRPFSYPCCPLWSCAQGCPTASPSVLIIGNMIPVPFIIIFIQRVFIWLRRHWPKMDSFITKLEAKAHLKGEKVQKYGPIALLLFVGIPLPGTGAWTGSLIAALLELKPKSAIPCIFLGVLLAAGIMTALTFGVIHVVN